MLKVNGKKIIVNQLSDGSSLSLGNYSCDEIVITWHYEDNSEIFVLCTVMRGLREFAKVVKKSNAFFVLEMPYMPYLMSFDDKKNHRNGDFAKLYTSDSLYSLPNACSNNTGIDKYNMVEIIDY